jgi:hypothetical protein
MITVLIAIVLGMILAVVWGTIGIVVGFLTGPVVAKGWGRERSYSGGRPWVKRELNQNEWSYVVLCGFLWPILGVTLGLFYVAKNFTTGVGKVFAFPYNYIESLRLKEKN